MIDIRKMAGTTTENASMPSSSMILAAVGATTTLFCGYFACSSWRWHRLLQTPLTITIIDDDDYDEENLKEEEEKNNEEDHYSSQSKTSNSNNHQHHLENHRVVIIGGGVSGLVTAKTYSQFGYRNVVVLEQSTDIGGVWNNNYVGAQLQGSYWIYFFADFPWTSSLLQGSSSDRLSPTCSQVQNYLRQYSIKFGVDKCIKYQHKVLSATMMESIKKGNNNKNTNNDGNGNDVVWKISIENQTEPIEADTLIVSTGLHDKSNFYIPDDIPNRDCYQQQQGGNGGGGQIFHTSQIVDTQILQDAKKIIVVGGSKSAYDVALLHPKKTTLIMRKPHWFSPRWMYLPPFSDKLMYYLCGGYSPIVEQTTWLWRLLDRYVLRHITNFCLTSIRPSSPSMFHDLLRGGGFMVASTNEQRKKAKKDLSVEISPIESYTKTGLCLENGRTVDGDVIIFGTGFRPSYGLKRLFPQISLQDETLWEDGLYLYKYLVHPKLPRVYFIGYHDSFTSCMVGNAQAIWAVRCTMMSSSSSSLSRSPAPGRSLPPTTDDMEKYRKKQIQDSTTLLSPSHRRAHFDYFGRKDVGDDLTYCDYLIRECGFGDRIAKFGCHHWDPWSSVMNFAAVVGAEVVYQQRQQQQQQQQSAST